MRTRWIVAIVAVVTCEWTAMAQIPPTDQAAVKRPPAATYSGGDGASCDTAVKIEGARDTGEGIAAEKAWVTARYPGFELRGQSMRNKSGRVFDVIDITTGHGERKSICFDITEFFGKW